jgi:hypothetical protein
VTLRVSRISAIAPIPRVSYHIALDPDTTTAVTFFPVVSHHLEPPETTGPGAAALLPVPARAAASRPAGAATVR